VEQMTELSDIVARLTRVEKQNRCLKRAGLIVLLVSGTLAVLGATQPKRISEAEEFVLKDGNGTIRARLAMSLDRPTLTLVDAKGMPQVGLAGGQEPFLVLNQSSGESQVKLSSSKDLFGLALYGKDTAENHGVRAGLGVFQGIPALSLYNETGKEQVGLDLSPEFGASLVLSDVNGEPRTTLGVARDKTSFVLSDKEGFETTIGITELEALRTGEKRRTSAASIVLFGKNRKMLWSVP